MVKLFWGPPDNPGMMRFHTGTLMRKDNSEGTKHYTTHEIIGLYGVQVGKSFFGRVALGQWGMEARDG